MSVRSLTPLLTNAQIHRIERLRIGASRRFTNRGRGEHLAGRGGASTEFADFRDYHEGDDTRYIDWNIYSRLRRPYLKIFRTEEEMHVVLFVDASASMRFDGKLGRALSLAAAFGLTGLTSGERVSAVAFNAAKVDPARLPPRSGRASMLRLFDFLGQDRAPGAATLDTAVESALRLHKGRGAAILVSDFLTPGDLRRTFNQLHGAGLEILALHLHGPADASPPVEGDLRLVDCETGQTLDVSSSPALMEVYHDHRAEYLRSIEQGARRRGGNFLSLDATEALDHQLFDTLRRRGWLA